MKNWTIVFDLDGTLVDTAPDLAQSTNHVLHTLGLEPVDERTIRPFVGNGALAMVEAAARARGRTLAPSELTDLFEIFIAHYATHISAHSKPYDGMEQVLHTLKADGARLAVCTNKIETLAKALLRDLNLTHYFAAITGRDTLGAAKPDPRHLTGTIALANGEAKRAIMVGDSETDIKTAKAAGIPVVAVDFGYSLEPVATFKPDAVVSSYPGVLDALRRIHTGAVNA